MSVGELVIAMRRTIALGFGAVFLCFALSAQAGSYSIVHSFGAAEADGTIPKGRLLQDMKGNVWGTTCQGGAYRNARCGNGGCGTVFKIAANGTYAIVHSFGADNTDGSSPLPGLILAKKVFWGTTANGGAHGHGSVFKFAADGTYSVVHSFGADSTDGKLPQAGLMQDALGNLWGTTVAGGAHNGGVVFKIAADGAYSIVYGFGGAGTDGTGPLAGLTVDQNGKLWGTTYAGGAKMCDGRGCGTVFSLDPKTGREKVMHSFGANIADGWSPYAGLLRDRRGNLWGTTFQGGAHGDGTVFKITANGAYSVVHSFGAHGTDGTNPYAGLIQDKSGTLWGTTVNGGDHDDGTAFEIATNGMYSVVHNFGASATDGTSPYAGLMRDRRGRVWGTTYQGGAHDLGTVFKLKP